MKNKMVDSTLNILNGGEIQVEGQITWGSNEAVLVQVECDEGRLHAVYKPSRGERPLWDFPRGTLSLREYAAYLISQSLRWGFVPPTVLREDGPEGPGSLQLFIHFDPNRHYFSFTDDEKQRLRPLVVFDLLINNADRKGGHVLIDDKDQLWSIDHGVCFHHEYKLRTVIWDFIGEPIPEAIFLDLHRIKDELNSDSDLRAGLHRALSEVEIQAIQLRADRLIVSRTFPEPGLGRPYPWPLV